MKIAICGGPLSGKSLLAKLLDIPQRQTDDWWKAGKTFNENIIATRDWLGLEETTCAVSGVTVVYALRLWMAENPEGKPCDVAVFLHRHTEDLSPRQRGMTIGMTRAWDKTKWDLTLRGVRIVEANTMSKEAWFRHLEDIDAEHPELTEEEAGDMAQERLADEWAAQADQLKDELKYEVPEDD